MKGKKKNTFKFKNFSERINEINIDVFHSTNNTHKVPENDKDTFFREALEKWSELNCSLDFTRFYNEVKQYVQSFNQLLYHKETIVKILSKYLSGIGSLALEPCLDLLAQFARDLLHEFYPYFAEFLGLLFPLLKGQDTALIENTFTCLAYVFKFGWRFMIKDLHNVFRLFKPLLMNNQKRHVNVFAAESFAFLIRKSKVKVDVIRFLFTQLDQDENIAEGLGFLLFHSIKGVKQQFTLNAAEILQNTCEIFRNQELKEQGLIVLKNLWVCSLQHCTEEHSSVLFSTLYNLIENEELDQETFVSLIEILDTCVQYKGGKLVPDTETLCKILLMLLTSARGALLRHLLNTLLTSSNLSISISTYKELCDAFLFNESLDVAVKLEFSHSLFSWIHFDDLLKPSILKMLSVHLSMLSTNDEIAHYKTIISDFIVDMICENEEILIQPFSINSPEQKLIFPSEIQNKKSVTDLTLNDLEGKQWETAFHLIWIDVVCLGNIRLNAVQERKTIEALLKLIGQYFSLGTEHQTNKSLFVFSHCIKAYLSVQSNKSNISNDISVEKMVAILRSHPANHNVLQCFEAFCGTLLQYCESAFTMELQEIHDIIKENLYSPHSLIRLLSLKILNHFHGIDKEQKIPNEVFQLCINSERVSASLDSYRERMMHLRKLSYSVCKDLPTIYVDTALRFLIGNLFINLSVIWDPVIDLISSYAHDSNHEIFWNIWKDVVVAASLKCESNSPGKSSKTDGGCKIFDKYYDAIQSLQKNTRVDYYNFRTLMWKAMTQFSDFAERKSRDIVPLFFKFFMNEYSPQEELMARKQDIKVKSSPSIAGEMADEMSVQKIDRKVKIKTLCTMLKLFSSFKNPRALSKEKELLQLYYQLLTNKDNEVQKLSLSCLYTYKFTYMKPYVENFDKLMNDGTFRDELTCFAGDSAVLKEEHREDVMPILIRLLYGKLQRKAGLGISGKSSLTVRRNIVMQFLANCSDQEIKTFFDLILQPFIVKETLDVTFNLSALDVSCIIPIRKQSGFLNMLSNVITKLKKRLAPFQSDLFLILLKIIWTCSICLRERKQEIDLSFVGRLKDLRHLGIMKLVEFFEVMTTFDYQHYIEEIFTSVCPQLDLIKDDAVQNITPLLRLFLTWSKHNRYQPLLSKVTSNGNTPIDCVYKLLDKTSLSNEVEKELMTMSVQLLTSEDFVEDGKNGSIIELVDRSNRLEKMGIIIIKPYVSILINYLSTKLTSKLKKLNLQRKQKIGQIIPDVQLSVLSHISEFVTDKVQCDALLKILFPLLQCIAAEETQLHVLTTIKHLLPLQDCTDEYLPILPSLFSSFNSRKTRQVLCDVYTHMTADHPTLSPIALLLVQLNSWDKKRLEEPDYEQRLEAYREISENLKTNSSWNMNQVLPLLHDSLHVVATTDDMSLRDAASSCLQKIILFVKQNQSDAFHTAISKSILPAVKNGLKLKKEAPRNEMIDLLAFMVRTFDCETFNDMKVLTCSDAEADFFNNIRHIQVHRRIRALHLLSKVCKEKQITVSHMFSLFLPMINHVIFDDLAATKDHNLLSETIATIGAILNCLPWSKYLHILSSYLKLMKKGHRNLKTIIRVVIAILDSFHFDVSENITCVQNKSANLSGEDDSAQVDDEKDEDRSDQNENAEDDAVSKENGEIVSSPQRILNTISTRILPQIKSFLYKKSNVDHFHKLSNNKQEDDEEIMKVPMALAMVKLLQHLPKSTLHTYLPGVLLRVSQSLRSHARDVRDIARDTLKKICLSLGASYFHMVLKEMRSVLLRGYQLHILGYTVHTLLDALKDILKPGDMDNCVDDLMQIVKEELYGVVSEEKDVSGITGKLMEAKSHKANDSVEIFSKFVTAGCITRLLRPLKEILDSTTSHKTSRKVEESLRRISLGLQTNKGLTIDDLLLFIHGVVSSTLPMLNNEQNRKKSNHQQGDVYVREDIYIVPSMPVRGGKLPAASKMTNDHVLTEFGLQLLHTCLKRQRLSSTDDTHVRMLDPFVGLLLSNITSKYSKVIILTMRCLSFLVKFPLPSIKDSVPLLAKHLFKILKRYAKAGAGQGDNFDLVVTSFKTMTVIIRDYKDFTVTNKQLRLLLAFVEEDVYNSSRQATALPLLKAILSRKLMVSEVHDIMKKISDLSVRDSDETTRLQCRQLMSQYLLDYPLGKKLASHLDFFITHLSYEDEIGRLSSLEMIKTIIKNFPSRLVQEYSGYFFIPLVMLLGNDESSKCRKSSADIIKVLLRSLDNKTRNELFDITLTWSHQEKVLMCQVAMQAFGMFIEVEEKQFDKKIEALLPVVQQVLKDAHDNDDDDDDESDATDGSGDETDKKKESKRSIDINSKDKLLYNTLTCLGKLLLIPQLLLRNGKYESLLADIWKCVHGFLLHPHVWIRLASSQLFSLYFGAITPEEIAGISETSSEEYLLKDTVPKIKDLVSSFFLQMKDENLTAALSEQTTKNLIYLTKVVKAIDPYLNERSDDAKESGQLITIKSLVVKMSQLASYEASNTPKQTLKRTCVFRWVGALCLNMDERQMTIYLPNLLRSLHREISSETESELRTLAQEVLELIRTSVSKDVFAEAYAKLQMKVADVRESRKRKAASEAVADPVKHALRKQKNNLAKRQQRKRKLYEKKPNLKFKKIRSQAEV